MKYHTLLGEQVAENDSGYLNANSLIKVGNKYRRQNNLDYFNYNYWKRDARNIKLIADLKHKLKCEVIVPKPLICTWMHPELFVSLACKIIPGFKVEDHEWLNIVPNESKEQVS